MQRTTKTHKIDLRLGTCEKVKGDRNRIAQVLTNLISNAIKYFPLANKIIITTSCSNNTLELCVRNFGIGMPAEQQSKIFEKFYRVTGKDNHTYPGLGLGLQFLHK